MAHFAEIDSNNKVIRVLVTDNDLPNEGAEWLVANLGGTWIQTSYNATIRGKFAGIGDSYDSVNDRFVLPQPYKSWKLNDNFEWHAPKPQPTDGKPYEWDEKKLAWVEIVSVS